MTPSTVLSVNKPTTFSHKVGVFVFVFLGEMAALVFVFLKTPD